MCAFVTKHSSTVKAEGASHCYVYDCVTMSQSLVPLLKRTTTVSWRHRDTDFEYKSCIYLCKANYST